MTEPDHGNLETVKYAVYRCGPDNWGCGHEFRVEHDVAPYNCPECSAVFCGDECCGNCAEFVRYEEEY